MGTKDCDFWGVTENQVGLIPSKNDKYKTINCKHLQSYFLVFKKNVFTSKVFLDFIKSVKHFENKNDVIINCEIGLSKILYSNGFVSDCYIKKYRNFDNVTIYFWRQLIKKYKMPFVKCSILRHQNDDRTYSDGWQNLIASCSNYPISIIEKNLETYITNPKNSSCIKMLCLNVVAFLPSFFKKVFRKIMKNNF
jgi:rhamnosyltransferase